MSRLIFRSIAALLLLLIAPAATAEPPPNWKEAPFHETAPEPALTPEETTRGFMAFTRPITEPVYPETRPLAFERATILATFATPGEFEPVLLGVYPVKELRGLTTSVTPLAGPTGEIPSEAIDVRHGRHSYVRFPMYTTKDTCRRMVELLDKAVPVDTPAKETHQWWLTIKVPADAKPGIYHGTVTVQAEGAPSLRIPLSLRILGFELKKDPAKHYTAYYYDLFMRQKNTMAALDPSLTTDTPLATIAMNEYHTMRDYGFDMPPTGYLSYDKAKNRFFYNGAESLELMRKAGLTQSPYMLVVLGNAIAGLFQKYTGAWIPSHCLVREMPPQAFFDEITELTRQFDAERKANGWPEFVYNPLDEVDAAAWEFGSKVHMAVKKAGARIYTTKDPKGVDAPKYFDCVDIWCSQPYSTPYEQTVKDSRFRYWSYPNHNCGELKSREIMMKGGRMTYGYGFWRSGYEGLVPWHWRWDVEDPVNYLDGKYADTGNKLTREGAVTPAVYWSCFREGYDDARYLYTLQQAITEREKSADPACRALVDEGKKFLQALWDGIEVQEKYLATGMWPSEDFQNHRWQMATRLEALLKFPADAAGVVAPSVLVGRVETPKRTATDDILQKALSENIVDAYDLGDEEFPLWKNVTSDCSVETVPSPAHHGGKAMRMTVRMDHAVDGESGSSGNGVYPKGWPRVIATFPSPLALTTYDYVSLWLMIDSDRDEVADDMSPLFLDVITGTGKYYRRLLNEAEQRQWLHLVVPVSELAALAGDARNLKELKALQFWLPEGDYPDRSTVTFTFDEIAFLRFKQPVLSAFEAPAVGLVHSAFLPVAVSVLGDSAATPGQYQLRFTILSGDDVVSTLEQDLKDFRRVGLPVDKLTSPGNYILRAEIMREGKTISTLSSKAEFVNGPLVVPAK